MSKDKGGIEISNDDNFDNLANPSGSVKEVDITSSGGDIIDPRNIAAQAAAAAQDNHDLDDADDEDENPLQNIQNADDEDEDEDEPEGQQNDPAAKKKEPTKKDDDDDSYQTFKILGKHFSDEGILVGFSDEMENTPEALQNMVKETVNKGIEEYKNSFKHPMAKQFLEYLENGGDPGRFVNIVSGPDYTGIDVEDIKDNVNIQKQLLRDQLSSAGESQEDIEETIQAYEDAGVLEKRSSVALKKLQDAQVERQKKEVETQKEQRKAREEQNNKILSDLKNTIDSTDELGGFQLSKKEKSDFYDYITKVDSKTGKTPLMADSSDPKNQLLMSYLYFKKFNFDKLEKKSKTEAVKSLEEQLGRFTDSSARNKSRKTTKVVKNEPGQLNLGPLKKAFSK